MNLNPRPPTEYEAQLEGTITRLKAESDALKRELAKAKAFKTWVHKYLDDHEVPHHPPGTHGAEGCRIGDRMDWLMKELETARTKAYQLDMESAMHGNPVKLATERDSLAAQLQQAREEALAVEARTKEAFKQLTKAPENIPGEYEAELDRCDNWIKWCEENGNDWYGINFHQGRRSGIIEGNIIEHKAKEQLKSERDAALAELAEARKALAHSQGQTAYEGDNAERAAKDVHALKAQLSAANDHVQKLRTALEEAEEGLRGCCLLIGFDPSDGEGTSPQEVVEYMKSALASAPASTSGDRSELEAALIEAAETGNYVSIYLPLESQDRRWRARVGDTTYIADDFAQVVKRLASAIEREKHIAAAMSQRTGE